MPAIRPSSWVPRSPRYVGGDSAESRGILANANTVLTDVAKCFLGLLRGPPISSPAMPTAVVTGAGRGLGRAIAEALAARGLTLHVTDVDEEAAEAVAAELSRGAFFSPLD